jgi:thioredoxin reductase
VKGDQKTARSSTCSSATKTTPYETVIVGAGPAGLSAALVLGRCRRRVLIIDSGHYRNERSTALHCFMGCDGIPPAKLLARSRRQLASYDTVTYLRGRVTGFAGQVDNFAARCEDGSEFSSRTLLVATGVVDELPSLDGIDQLFGRSVHVCPYCDGWEHRDAPVAVFGQASKGAGLALLLRQWTHDLVLCTHGPAHLSVDEGRMLNEHNIIVREKPIARLEGEDGCLRAIHFTDGERLPRNALFFNTGQHPRSTLLESLGCAFNEKGAACDEDGLTSVPGVYVAGDASRNVQLVISPLPKAPAPPSPSTRYCSGRMAISDAELKHRAAVCS